MRAIQAHLPHPRHVEIHRVTVQAPPDIAWQVARHFDGASIPWVRLLFDLRTLPNRMLGHAPAVDDRRLGVDQITAATTGFMLLEERPGQEFVVGAVGQFWQLEIPFAKITPADFAKLDAPGWGKVAWSVHVEPFGTGSQIVLELRTTATDEESWKKQVRYFHVIGPASHLIRSSMMAHLEAELGPMPRPGDKERPLPGDELVQPARYSLTHGIDIEAPPSLVWPWLMQLGCDRGGWYSIDGLDHGGVPSVEHIVSEWQSRRVGDKVVATPKGDGFFDVLAVEEQKLFVLGSEVDRLGGHMKMSWSFVPEPLGADATHLVTRVRAHGHPRWSEWLQGAVMYPPIHAVMQHAQLENIKRLAESAAQARPRGRS